MGKIIFVFGNLFNGGISTLVYRKSKWLVENGYEVTILTTEYGEPKMKNDLIDLGCNLLICNEINYSPNKIFFREMINIYNKVVKEIADINEIEFIECFTPLETYYGMFLANLLNKKLITGVYHPESYTYGYTFGNKDYFNLFKNMDENNCLIFMNEDVMRAHEKYFNYNVKNKNIIGLPINIKNQRNDFEKNYEFKILSISRLCDSKKYVYGLISDFEQFYNTHQCSKLIIIGDGTEKTKLITYAKKFKAYNENKIEFLGTVQYSELDKYIYEASMGVGMGTSALEMASAGIPSIIAPAFVGHNISNGLNFKDINNVGDTKNSCTKTYKDYMEFLYNCNCKEYKEIGNKCRQAVIDNYSIDTIMNKYLNKVEQCNPIILSNPLDDFVEKSPLKLFLSLEKRKLKEKVKVFFKGK